MPWQGKARAMQVLIAAQLYIELYGRWALEWMT